ncbi:MAG: Ig-like domain-containing protein [Treponema sp.]
MNRKILFLACVYASALSFIFPAGKKDVETRTAETPESWNESFDISAKKKGKYNVIVTAEDSAGNIGTAGPFNMYIDPRSDLPVIRITNPVTDMSITGNLSVSGTCFDDDAVDYIEVALDDGEPIRAKGQQFWSCVFETAGLEEGPHRITAWGVDINGMKGQEQSIRFNLNLYTPETVVTNMDTGALISGKRILEGMIQDGNGVKQLFYSFDAGQTYTPLPFKFDKKNKISTFKLPIDTRKMPEGPTVCWFKAVDKLGSEGISTFLFFIDNTDPVIDFFYPSDSEPLGSVFGIAGSAVDTVELESVSWKMGNVSGVFELVKGNPYWVKEFDVSKSSNKSETVEIIAKDVAGNITTVKRTLKIDKTKDLPKVKIAQPVMNAVSGGRLYLAGTVESAFGFSEIRYRLDKNEEAAIPVTLGPFGVAIENLSAGPHSVTVYAVNAQGVKGPAETVSFSVMGKSPVIGLEGTGNLVQIIPAEGRTTVGINVNSEAGLETVSYSIDGNADISVPVKRGALNALIRIPSDPSFAGRLVPVTVQATDVHSRSVSQTILLESQTAGEEELRWAGGSKTDTGAFIVSGRNTLYAVYRPAEGAEIDTVGFVKEDSRLDASFSGHIVTLTTSEEGLYKDIQLVITDTEGKTFTAEAIDILVDNEAPAITLTASDEVRVVKNAVEISGSISDVSGLHAMSYTIGDSEPSPITQTFTQKIPLEAYPDGLIVVGIHAVDGIGKKASLYRVFYKDTQGPEISMIVPKAGDKVNGAILTAFKAANHFLVEKAEYKAAGTDMPWEPIEISPLIHKVIGTAAAPISKDMQFRFTDAAGNVTVYNDYGFEIDTEADKPVIEVHLPVEDAVITKDFSLSGIVYDDDGVSKIFYKIDEGSLKAVETANTFSIPFKLTDFEDNEHTISIYAEDIYGVKSNIFSRKVRVSLVPPSGEVLTPLSTAMVKDSIAITGKAFDKNGIESVAVSLDNGNTYHRAEGTDAWKYEFNTHIIDDGTHVVFVKLIDKYGEQTVLSTLVNIDNTPPVLQFEYPIPGGRYDNMLFVSGQMHDDIALKEVFLHIKGLEGQNVSAQLAKIKLDHSLLASQDINIASLASGVYNLEIIGMDAAGNVTNIARNFIIDRSTEHGKIDLLYPMTGETITGEFNIYGRITSTTYPDSVSLYVDGKESGTSQISATGYFSFKIMPEDLTEGMHQFFVKAEIVKGKPESSPVHSITYSLTGPWVTIDNFEMGDFAVDRPYLKGRAGYSLSEEETVLLKDKTAPKDVKTAIAAKKPVSVEISFNNGRTFISLRAKEKWRYRLETGDMPEGEHFVLIRAKMANDEIAVCRTIVSVDKTVPKVTLITPDEGGLYNQSLVYAGLASDDIAVTNVELALRKGDKYLYSVPAAMQGLHFDVAFWGATFWNMGLGLSFFDNNVKLQLHYGQFLQSQWDLFYKGKIKMRYGGHVLSMKILANVFELPFERFAGPDWSWLYMTGALGANFSVFTQTQSGKPQVLSAMLAQIEFPRVKLPKKKVKYFRSFALYTEGQLWFIPTDVSDSGVKSKKGGSGTVIRSVLPHISVGFRFEVF